MKTLIRLDRWKQHQGIEEPIERVFESGDNHQGAFLEKMRLTEGAPSISFKPKAFTPLQQGDLISWHLARSVRDVFQGKVQGLEDLREAWWLLEEHPNKDWGIYTYRDALLPGSFRSRRSANTQGVIQRCSLVFANKALGLTMSKGEHIRHDNHGLRKLCVKRPQFSWTLGRIQCPRGWGKWFDRGACR